MYSCEYRHVTQLGTYRAFFSVKWKSRIPSYKNGIGRGKGNRFFTADINNERSNTSQNRSVFKRKKERQKIIMITVISTKAREMSLA